ncbi:DUF4429 domain-containing protein [Furfurilactobacillus rossiae]|uniref:SHOCT domain-containing protein n=1 Tax=Furfurilactobacillus rossiae DSM 15814 TaxID=1114972 RepID=A0A0R1RNQ8_9LACO|nr:DUF4429 domain-containing protein [Furfurilactobacillus rossiae]KRL56628.1 hypothetical protein FD35_GL001723 [Furfurilactobacillus rossiae DSM 15814]QFR66471.1 DUF4429 domain-containing protein [Furfurilactobacillus rossiae]QLE61932.1 hypothetical protein LROSRS0_1887 [Furfurilactobacillus rossiae]
MEKEYNIKSPGHTIISLTDNAIVITRKGMINAINQGLKGAKTIPLKSITAVQIKKPGLTNGYIQFTIPGGNESHGGVLNATHDENTVMFSGHYFKQMQELKETVEQIIFADSSSSDSFVDAADQIRKMKYLLDDGIITEDEFNEKKKQLLGI